MNGQTSVRTLDDVLALSERWMVALSTLTEGVAFESTRARRLGLSLLHLSIEHYQALHVLCENRLTGSAMAILRPQYEAMIRGTWLVTCASERDVVRFMKGNPPSAGDIVRALESHERHGTGTLDRLHAGLWKHLHDFTHGGIAQVNIRLSKDEIAPPADEGRLAVLLQGSIVLSWVAGNELAIHCADQARYLALRDAFMALELRDRPLDWPAA